MLQFQVFGSVGLKRPIGFAPGSDGWCLVIVLILGLGTLVTRGDPIPEPDPARILGKYYFSVEPGQKEYTLSKKPVDLSQILGDDDLDPDSSASYRDLVGGHNHNHHNHNNHHHSSSSSSHGSGTSPGFMTSYTTSTRHGHSLKSPSLSYDSGSSDEDSDERGGNHNYGHSSSAYYSSSSSSNSGSKRKPIIPILQSYSIIHATKDHHAPPSSSVKYVGSSSGNSYTGNSGPSGPSNSDEEDYYESIPYTPPKVVHTKARAVPIAQHIEVERPEPIPYVKKIHVPVPTEVKIQIPHPVLVPVPQPYPVHVPVSQPVAVPVIREITIPIEKIVPYPVEKRVPIPIEKPVPYPVEKHIPVHIPQPYPVKVPVVKTIYHKYKAPRTVGVGSVTIPE
ncbi:E3 ubiquitin-protein ligase arkadia-B [Culex quinquefasciatus]|uniref:E3 ubiquitin-protein ligase arkadia-B n=1 Tax=Culex quinquefasciatus TaxID=7176 RepID=UPI0018E3F2B2|nr:E3 ubiquitin-protein ligase arkadia-B [Culex quinquefasciatus]